MENDLILPKVSVSKPRRVNVKFIAAGLVIVAAMAFLAVSSFQSNSMYYMTVPELKAQAQADGAAFYDKMVRVSGPLHKESIDWNAKTLTLKFHINEGNEMFPVVFVGPIPDTMENGETVVVEGKYTREGVFNASNILVKCPSKYEPAQSG
ncbi:MAG: cytochrome c maturation protein CcmE [Chloroflexota bacterium]|nr:cytochrome c maturation protein CcmE [Chloroflexota bacterium]